MIILQHIEHRLANTDELIKLQIRLMEMTSKVRGVTLLDIYFPTEKDEVVIALDCESEEKYLEWRKICPPPDGAYNGYEVWMTKAEKFLP